MSRRSRRRTATLGRSGEPFFGSSTGVLPRAHEGVRRFAGAREARASAFDFAAGRPWAPRSAFDLAFAFDVGFRRYLYPANFGIARYGRLPSRGAFAPLRSLSMRVPSKVRFCVQRAQRREVLFAKRRAGFSGSAPKLHYRRRQESQYAC